MKSPRFATSFWLLLCSWVARVDAQPCIPVWAETFSAGDVPDSVGAVTAFDEDGPGPAPPVLYAGGGIYVSSGAPHDYIVRLVEGRWRSVGTGVNERVDCFLVHDDGAGPSLVAGGAFTIAGGIPAARIARWNGQDWSPLGAGIGQTGEYVTVLEAFDEDGAGPQPARLFAGGDFTLAGGNPAVCLARWNGQEWTSVGSGAAGIDRIVTGMIVHDDGTGPALYVGGRFAQVSGVPAANVARWTGVTWQSLGAGLTPFNGTIGEFAVFDDDGPGPNPALLYAGGDISFTVGFTLNNLARWDGISWAPIGGPAMPGSGADNDVYAMRVFDDDGAGPNPISLFVAGAFTGVMPGGTSIEYRRVARWDGQQWHAVGQGTNSGGEVFDLTVFDPDEGGPEETRLVAAGAFGKINGVEIPARGIAAWNGHAWTPFGLGLNDWVRAIARLDPDGPGPEPAAIHVAGDFTHAGDVRCNGVARWDGTTWAPLGGGIGREVRALVSFDQDGPAGLPPIIIAAGRFVTADGAPARRIAAWNGSQWTEFAGGIGPAQYFQDTYVHTLAVFDDDGPGPLQPRLYAGGDIASAGGVPVKGIAAWDGASWSSVNGGVSFSTTEGDVYAMTTFDDGTGEALYAGGAFSLAGGQTASRVARWNGTAWSALGSGMNAGGFSSAVYSLSVFNAGTGPALYAGGTFQTAGGINTPRIAKWDGEQWSALGTGIVGQTVWALIPIDFDGAGPGSPVLVAGGRFTSAGGVSIRNLAAWDGQAWSALGTGTAPDGSEIYALLADNSTPAAPALYAGGHFTSVNGVSAGRLAVLQCDAPDCYADCNADGTLTVADFGCFQTRFVAGDPYADCNADGSLTVADFGCFQTKFVAGCP